MTDVLSAGGRGDARKTRRPGRPIGKGGSHTQADILTAARELLRRAPPAKLTQEALADLAGVDRGSVKYYFPNNTLLLIAVVRDIMGELLAELRAAISKSGSPAEMLRHRVTLMLEAYAREPHFVELMETTAVDNSDEAFRMRIEAIIPFYNELQQILGSGLREGTFRPVNAAFVHMAVIGICRSFVHSYPMMAETVELGSADAVRQAYAEFASDFVLRALAA